MRLKLWILDSLLKEHLWKYELEPNFQFFSCMFTLLQRQHRIFFTVCRKISDIFYFSKVPEIPWCSNGTCDDGLILSSWMRSTFSSHVVFLKTLKTHVCSKCQYLEGHTLSDAIFCLNFTKAFVRLVLCQAVRMVCSSNSNYSYVIVALHFTPVCQSVVVSN